MRAAFQKAYDKKSQWIQDLDKTLNGNEGDYLQATNAHLYSIDKMMGLGIEEAVDFLKN